MLPGITVGLLIDGCWGVPPALGRTLCAALDAHSTNDVLLLGIIPVLYIGLRGLDAKKVWDATQEVSWFTEVALLVVGGNLVWLGTAASIIFLGYKAIDS
jgi:hypothetical protein